MPEVSLVKTITTIKGGNVKYVFTNNGRTLVTKYPDVLYWIEDYQSGMLGKHIALKYNASLVAVYRIFQKLGIDKPGFKGLGMSKEERRLNHNSWHRKWNKSPEGLSLKQRFKDNKNNLKNKPCADCGQQFISFAMEFDHLKDKEFKISHNGYKSLEVLQNEVSKCDVVCILCHRERTHSRYVYSDSKSGRSKRTLAEKVNEFKNGPCAICLKTYKPWQMDFDHLDPNDKYDKISNLVRRRCSLDKIKSEIFKCRLLCALCHRIFTEESRVK
jgi:hypothetical protein